ncbi:hypothetical protein CANINC_003888 [Pichia inconspicua]|uniref:Peroxin-19 n=1 Tax=Pichia inconspicua TaxID=52247 RepID=A0A4T0WXG6_9ASCO|nr:hypothetical protein CANINC_003888 [[Candida] inconspicua]
MADEFDDLDDYLDEFDEEILSQEPGATLKKHSPELSKTVEEFVKELEPEAKFGNTINDTINRLKTSNKSIDETVTVGDENEELLATLLNSLDIGDGEDFDEIKKLLKDSNLDDFGKGDGDGDGDGDDVDKLSNMLMGMLNKLTTKEMMYDTISTTVNNYNVYFEKNKPVKGNKDHDRFVSQLRRLQNVLDKFDSPNYSPDDEVVRDYIDEQMEEFNKLLPAPEGVVEDNLGALGIDKVSWNDNEVPKDLENCVQQ